MKQYDIIVVGTGGATIVADAALKKGLKVAIIEKGKFGGTCLTRGCIPTKVMVTAANAIQETKEFKKIGVNVGPATMDWHTVSKRTWHKIDESAGIYDYYNAYDNVDVYRGAALVLVAIVMYLMYQVFKNQGSLLVKVSLVINSLNNHINPLLYLVRVRLVLSSLMYLIPLVQK